MDQDPEPLPCPRRSDLRPQCPGPAFPELFDDGFAVRCRICKMMGPATEYHADAIAEWKMLSMRPGEDWTPGIPQPEHKRVLFRTRETRTEHEHTCMLVWHAPGREWVAPELVGERSGYEQTTIEGMVLDHLCSFKVLP